MRLKEEYIDDLNILVKALEGSPFSLVGGKKPALVLSLPRADENVALREGIQAMRKLVDAMEALSGQQTKNTDCSLE